MNMRDIIAVGRGQFLSEWVCSVLKVKLLSDVCRGRDNNLNLIRLLAATAVIVSHAWPISLGLGTVQPLADLTGYDLGSFGLFTFFSISGFLIARSFERQPTLRHWLTARVLRLFPALAVVLVLTVLVLGPLLTTLPPEVYFGHPETQSYIPRNLTLAFRQSGLPGVFETQPLAGEVNGPLWTLFYEVLCYGGVMIMGLLGAFRAWRPLIAVALVYVLANAAAVAMPRDDVPVVVRSLLSLGMPFAIGVAFYLGRSYLPLTPLILAGLVAASALVKGTLLYQPVLMLTLCYGVFVLAYLPGGVIRRYNRLGDYSYGLYIYGWPMQQTVVFVFGAMSPLTNVALALPMALALAWLSWTWVEKPALALVPHSDPFPGAKKRPGAPPPGAPAVRQPTHR
jgi:peptidoglycan/LPS O-acetylase OafA/YrhL